MHELGAGRPPIKVKRKASIAVGRAAQHFFERCDDVLFVQAAPNGDILATNRGFRREFGLKTTTTIVRLSDIALCEGDWEALLSAHSDWHEGVPCKVVSIDGSKQFLLYRYTTGDSVSFYGLAARLPETRASELLSDLTTEMGNMVRETRRLNRELALANAKVSQLAQTDGLTKLLNHNAFMERTQQLCLVATRHHRPMTLVMTDLDHFKKVNDQFGHQAGDTVLENLGRLILELSRASDVAGRYGGEEFIVLLPETDLDAGVRFAERLRTAQQSARSEGVAHPVTLSLGVTEFQPGDTPTSLIQRADQALYRAKQEGRNRVVSQ